MHWRTLILAGMTLLAVVAAGHAAQVIPVERTFPEAWQNAGYPGEIPAPDLIVNVKDHGAVGDGVANDYPAVAAALAALGGGPGVVYFPGGTFKLSAKISLTSGVVLRGERPSTTTLLFDANVGGHCIDVAKNLGGAFQAMVAGHTNHSEAITVTDGTAFTPGDYAQTRRTNDPAWGASAWAPDIVGQILRVTAVTGNVVHLERPLRITYPANAVPEIRKIAPMVTEVGIENLRIERVLTGTATSRNNQFTIRFRYAARCWVRGVESHNTFGGHVGAEYSTQIDITGCDFHDAHEHDGGGSGYGVRLEFSTGEVLTQDNLFRRLRHSMLVQAGVNGNVFGYNYSREPMRDEFPSDLASDITLHGNYPYANLYEGNRCQHINPDASHGANGPLNTFFRNRAETYGFRITDTQAHNQNIVGNETFDGPLAGFVGDGYSLLTTTGHVEYGNNTEPDGIQAPGTGDLTEYSYYLNDNPGTNPPTPAFWDITNAIPTIGVPAPLNPAKDIPAGSRYFNGDVLTVGTPSLATQPLDVTTNQGETAMFSVQATGTPIAVYQWRQDGTPIPGGTNATLTLTNVQPADAGVYTVVVSDPDGSVTSAGATLTVNAAVSAHGVPLAWLVQHGLTNQPMDVIELLGPDGDGCARHRRVEPGEM